MLIDFERFNKAAGRLAKRELQQRIDARIFTIRSRREFDGVLGRAMLPYMYVKLAQRLFDRGHIILNFETREAIRNFRVDA